MTLGTPINKDLKKEKAVVSGGPPLPGNERT